MEKLIDDTKARNEYDLLQTRTNKLINDNQKIINMKNKVSITDLERIYEDFTYGIDWIRIFIE